MKAAFCRVGVLLLMGAFTAEAAPNIPPSEMPGRERQRFQDSPLDQFNDPAVRPRSVEPLWQWQCHQRSTSRYVTRSGKRNQGC